MRKNLKKIVALNLAVVLAFSTSACGDSGNKSGTAAKSEKTTQVKTDRTQAEWTKNAVIYETI